MNSLIIWLLSWLSFHTSLGVAQLKSRFTLAHGVSLVSVPHNRVVCWRGVLLLLSRSGRAIEFNLLLR